MRATMGGFLVILAACLLGCSTDFLVVERTDIVTATPEVAPVTAGGVNWLAMIDVFKVFETFPARKINSKVTR